MWTEENKACDSWRHPSITHQNHKEWANAVYLVFNSTAGVERVWRTTDQERQKRLMGSAENSWTTSLKYGMTERWESHNRRCMLLGGDPVFPCPVKYFHLMCNVFF